MLSGRARPQSHSSKNYALELTALGLIAGKKAPPECNGGAHPGRTAFLITVSPAPG